MVAAECEPFAKTGGLADVVDALSRALTRLGHTVHVFLPRYRGVAPPDGARRTKLVAAGVDVDLWTGEGNGYIIRLVDHPPSFDRDGLYGENGTDYEDNAARFALLGHAALATLEAEDAAPDVVHGHDWQAGPILMALDLEARPSVLRDTATLLTCHNLAYHGWVAPERVPQLGLPPGTATDGGVDLLRSGILAADLVTTVSPTFARESRSAEYGAGLHDELAVLGDRYVGVMNGIDTRLWDPETDPALIAPYSASDPAGKRTCREDLCRRHDLDSDGPIMGMVGRLDPQKGFDLVAGAASSLLQLGARLVILGTGDARLLADLRAAAERAPDRVAIIERFDREEARRIYAGSDIFLMPSRFEPSGQGQLIALRYGSVPLVRHTGGLADTIRDADADRATGNGFTFEEATPEALTVAARRAIAAWRAGVRWQAVVARGMAEDHGWEQPAREYATLYRRARDLRID